MFTPEYHQLMHTHVL